MLAPAILVALLLLEVGFVLFCFVTASTLHREKAFAGIALFALFAILAAAGVLEWGFRWYLFGLLLFGQAIAGVVYLLRQPQPEPFSRSGIVASAFARCLALVIVMLPALLFPQAAPIQPTGDFAIGTASYTWTDTARDETFTPEVDQRKVTVQFWYPATHAGEPAIEVEGAAVAEGDFPLVVFSHGAFGYRQSNHSTYMDLASNGYVVASIDHPYHAFVTRQADGSSVIANMAFLSEVQNAQGAVEDTQEIFENSQRWLALRTADMEFVLQQIAGLAAMPDTEPLFAALDMEHVGVMGHSLGGAAAAQTGRTQAIVGAVVVVDGTMLGEQTGFADGIVTVTETPYPKPILNVYAEDHYNDALAQQENYANMVAQRHAVEGYSVVVNDAGHLNFTDLPLISPLLARLLGTGDIDAKSGIMTTNAVVLQFFDYFLKSSGDPLPRESVF